MNRCFSHDWDSSLPRARRRSTDSGERRRVTPADRVPRPEEVRRLFAALVPQRVPVRHRSWWSDPLSRGQAVATAVVVLGGAALAVVIGLVIA